ncbi:sigma-70 family RNA polymerase sigma factor [Myxococcus sp. RHSTA-1-4]|uniref:sigma-70 family RNA polymerase sigma factor n=1 Tax=Myxococcus sp. RHSTA-1-4 TaxID=2874601 RepID=UPI001CBE1599|nr:sigma-70 family RNA polymerase sigma factor [Myxococcus sp. RHSTA-1-4]MBZ4422695.1 sigma-70 family RNA polymerase sigma factor [Myxococcus sp. RHSTA-1-4]
MEKGPLSELSFEELLLRARVGEEGALEELFRRCQPALDAWASRRAALDPSVGTRPSDIVQDSALRAFEKFATFQGNSEGEWFAWLKQVVLSQSVKRVREARSQKRGASGSVSLDTDEALTVRAPQRSPSQFASGQEEWRELLKNFYALPDDQRDALTHFHLRGMSAAEVANLMGRSRISVESLMQRGVRTLRHRMAGGEGEAPEASAEEVAVRNAADAAFLSYLRRCEAGEVVDPDAFAEAHPACTEELRGMLHWLQRLRALRPSGSS